MKTPEELEKKIQALKYEKPRKSNGEFFRSLSLIWSIGITFMLALLLGFWLGRKIAAITGIILFYPLFLILGMALGGYLVYKLLKPYLK